MYISKIELKNIRGFTDLSFDLDRGDGTFAGWTVFTGDNGSGKSTLLKSLVLALVGSSYGFALEPNYFSWLRTSPGVKDGVIRVQVVGISGDDFIVSSGDTGEIFWASVALFRQPGASFEILGWDPNGRPLALSDQRDVIWTTPPKHGWFSCGYGPYRRIYGASQDSVRLMSSPSTERYATMFKELASLGEVAKWLQDLKFKKLEGKSEEGNVLDILLEILRDELLPNGFVVHDVTSDGLWLKDRNGVELAWSDMSDGYRSALALLADIFRHLITTYGIDGLTARNDEGKLYVTRSGVVLIDEIDAHMHPEWQREIGFWLKKHFPKIQFLVTTHSPIICQAADKNGLFVLPEPGSGEKPRALTTDEYDEVIRSRPDTILLSPAFGLQNTRSERVVEARAEYTWLDAKQISGAELSPDEVSRMQELLPLAVTDEEL